MRLHLTYAEHVVLQLGILGLIYVFLQMWMRANRSAMMNMDADALEQQGGWVVRVYQFPAAETIAENQGRSKARPLLRLPEGELNGVLSTTFEMEKPESQAAYLSEVEGH
jgi:hypothetical protein